MSLYFRLLWLLMSFSFRRKLIPPFDTSRLRLHVLPNDLDTNLHMNNGRYLTLMDLGRTDLILRGGLWRIILKNGWMPILSSAVIRYQRELRVFQRFYLESRIVYWSDKNFVMEQIFFTLDNTDRKIIVAKSLVRGGIYSRQDRQFIEVAKLFAALGSYEASPAVTPDVEAFLLSAEALKRS